MNPRRARLLTLVLAFAAAFLAFLPGLGNGFVDWDDTYVLVRNDAYRGFDWDRLVWMFTTTHKGPYQPLSWLSYAVDHALFGMDPFGYHLTNQLLHATAAALLALVALRLLPSIVPALRERTALLCCAALATATVWSCHPLRVESVAWATERRDVLSGALLLASLNSWLVHVDTERSPASRRRAYVVSVAWFVASLLAKATAMGWFVVLLLLDVVLRRDLAWRRRLIEKLPFALAALPIAAMALWGQADVGAASGLQEYGLLDRLVLAAYSAAFYAFRSIVPLDLRAHYERHWPLDLSDLALSGGALAAVAVTAAAAYGLRRRTPAAVAASAAWWSYLALLAPVSGLVVVGTHLVAERYSYLSTIPLALLVGGGAACAVARLSAERRNIARWSFAAGAVAAAALAGATWRLTTTWHDTETLFARVLHFEPDNWLAHFKVGMQESDRGAIESARTHLYRSVELYPAGRAETYGRLAHIEFDLGHIDDCRRLTDKALAADEKEGSGWSIRARLQERDGEFQAAEASLRKAVEYTERDTETVLHLAWLLLRRGANDEARPLIDEALAAQPRHAGAWRLRGLLLEGADDSDGALAAYRTSIECDPGSAASLQYLAMLCDKLGRGDEAVDAFRRAIEIDPSLVDTRAMLGAVLERRGDIDGAERIYREALALAGTSPMVHFRLGLLLQKRGDLDGAEGHLRRCVELDGGTDAALGALSSLLARRGRVDEAAELCAAAARRHPDRPGPKVELGRLYERAGRRPEALAAYRAALAQAPDDPDALLMTARLLAGDRASRDEAARLLERCLTLRDEPRTRLSLAELYAHEGRPDAARPHAQRALETAQLAGDTALAERARVLLASL